MRDKSKLKLIYLRLSLEDAAVASQAESESISIGSQRRCIQQYIAAHPDLGNAENFQELIDDGYSGTNFDRPSVTRLLELVELGKVETIIVRDLSRFARNYLDAGHFLEFVFPAHDVRFVSVNDNYDSRELGESTAGFQLAVQNLINQLYSRDISRKIKSAVDLKKLNGEYAYGAAPYGYVKAEQHNRIVVDAEPAAVVRQIFQWAAEGITVTQIASRLNSSKILTPSQYLQSRRGNYKVYPHWTFDSVKNILINRIYTGDTIPFKSHVTSVGSKRVKLIPENEQIVIPNTHEAIISRELFFLSRQVIKTNRKSAPQGPGSILSSYLVCGCCGHKLHKGRKTNKTFHCPTARYVPDSPCTGINIQEKRLADILIRGIQNQCILADAKIRYIREAQKGFLSERAALERELQFQQRVLEKTQGRILQDYEAYVGGRISKELFLQNKSANKQEEDSAELQIIFLQKQMERIESEAKAASSGIQNAAPLCKYSQVNELSAELLRVLVQKITVYPDGNVHIDWNFKDVLGASE